MTDARVDGLTENAAEPLTLADGRVIYPHGTAPPKPEPQVSNDTQPQQIVIIDPKQLADPEQPPFQMPEREAVIVAAQRRIDDLPDNPRAMNAISVVLSYKLFGLSDEDIATCTGASIEAIARIVGSAAYADMFAAVTRSVLDAEAASVRDLFQQYSRDAVGTLVETLKLGKRSDRVAAARDLLDRAGHRPADVVEHRHRMDGGLTIEVIRRDGHADVPTINMEIGND